MHAPTIVRIPLTSLKWLPTLDAPPLSLAAVWLSLAACFAATPIGAAESLPVTLQWNVEAEGRPVETVLSVNGRFLLAMHANGRVARWDLTTGKRVASSDFAMEQPAFRGRSVDLWFKNVRLLSPAFSPSGTTRLAPRTFVRIDPETGRAKSVPFAFDKPKLFSSSGGSEPADISNDARFIAIAADAIYLVNAATGKTVRPLTLDADAGAAAPAATSPQSRTAKPASVLSLAFSRDARHLASLESDGTITVWETASGKVKSKLRGEPLHTKPPADLVWFDDNTLLTPNSITDGKLVRWNLETGNSTYLSWSRPTNSSLPANPRRPKSQPRLTDSGRDVAGWDGQTRQFGGVIAFSPDGKRAVYSIASSTGDGRSNNVRLVVVDLPAGRAIGEFPLYPEDVFAAQFSDDSQRVLIGSRWGWHAVYRCLSLEQLDWLAEKGKPMSHADHRLPENPEVVSWSGYKPGDYVQHDATITHNLTTYAGIVSHRLEEAFEDQSGVVVAASTSQDARNQSVSSVAGPTVIPLSRMRYVPRRLAAELPTPTSDFILGRFEGKTTPQGKETLELGGQTYNCDVFKFDGLRYDTDGNAFPVAGKCWTCPDVPGLVVKCSSVSKLRTELRLDIVLKQIVRK